ncbi:MULTISPECIES: aminopeptidase [Brevibacillus]|uniref:Aminopeptidase n=1 Tax=Brevibacillus parabrevis TaxID=54914 RepID=A0A4Y3PEQ9_BREPA|nr:MULTISPECIES: aminopeptidase [Brevibacillus]MBU8715214.1 aminopeptidase [Brevibacillus parabrevis]MED2255021.1 aminopeptidase [Brevibacillus parabrevis]NRQ55027.1 aminopeptidase [Brevibacillus sp. HD1.4A]RNB93133.1 aminopeptidase [Brevibacillus parabrevis]WDV96120.1 aminopeptidase [Brevibacillus parabrevis]
MLDSRLTRLANVLVNYSTRVQPEDRVLIEAIEVDMSMVKELVKAVQQAGGHPFVNLRDRTVQRQLLLGGTAEQFRDEAEIDRYQMEKIDAVIIIEGGHNINELADVPEEQMKLAATFASQVRQVRLHKKWVYLRYPHPAMAQLANTSTEAFEQFYFDVCTMDYARMAKAMQPLKELMEQTDRVKIIGPGTELAFSIKGIPAVLCAGDKNVPDGEVFTAPVRDSVNGVITFNAPSPYQGFTFEHVRLEFAQGKIVQATANDTKRLTDILNTDEGARYIGEFALGVNPYIREPMRDILFDEKIDGSFHFTPGQCYDAASNGNNSTIHWDMVSIQRPEYGGGEIWFDDRLIRKDGRFVLAELEALNPEALK